MHNKDSWTLGATFSLSAIIILAASFRVFNLDLLEPFIDESLHLRWSMQERFTIDLIHGFKVLGYFIFYPLASWADNALLSTRLLVSLVGVCTAAGIFMAARELSNWKSAAIAGILWATLPYAVLHDRLALHDPLISFFFAWAIFFTALALKKQSVKYICLGGLLMGLASITKITALAGLPLIFFVSITIPNRRQDYFKLGAMFFVGMAIPFIFLLPQFIDNFDSFRIYLENFTGAPKKTSNLAYMEVSGFGVERIKRNLSMAVEWTTAYNGYAFCLLASISAIVAFFKPTKLTTGLAISFLVSILAFILVFKVWYPRYLIPSFIPLVILMGIQVTTFTKNFSFINLEFKASGLKSVMAIAVCSLLLITLYSTTTRAFKVAYTPQEANIPESDRIQYFGDSSSANGFNATKSFIDELASATDENIFVANIAQAYTDETYAFGLRILPMTLRNHKNMEFKSSSVFNVPLMQTLFAGLYQSPAKEKYIVGLKSALDKFLEYITLTPAPKLALENKRYFVYQIRQIDSWEIGGKKKSVITHIDNLNGVDYPNNKPLVWLGSGKTSISFLSPSSGLARFSFRVVPSPRVQGKLGLNLALSIGDKYKEHIFAADHGLYSLTIPVEGGLNNLILETSEQINVTDVNMTDKRRLVLGVTDIKIVSLVETINGASYTKIISQQIAKSKNGATIFTQSKWPVAKPLSDSDNVSVVSLLLQPRFAAIKILKTLYASRDKKVFILSQPASSEFIGSVMAHLTPPPQIVESLDDGTTLYTVNIGSWLNNEHTGVIVTDINNYNGVEMWKGTKSFWVGNKNTQITFLAQKSGRALIEMDISLGPNAQQTSREIIIEGDNGSKSAIKIESEKRMGAYVKMKRGTNLVKISSKNKSPTTDIKLKNDKRILIFGVSALEANIEGG